MKYIKGISADCVWKDAAEKLISAHDYQHNGRNGDTFEILPCVLRITNPMSRWILSRNPPYNPAFGLVEFICLLAGKDESSVPIFWNPALPKYSGDEEHFYGAYGYRLRKYFGFDQIKRAYHVLKNSPETRQAVLQIWDSQKDLPDENGDAKSKDIPCNLMALLKIRDNKLHWTQIMRSNDIMRGLPYNIIQFTMLQEVMASWLGCDIGEYFHLSDSLHVYTEDLKKFDVNQDVIYTGIRESKFDMTYERTETEISRIYSNLQQVADRHVKTQDELIQIFSKNNPSNATICESLQNILLIIGSDAARRLRYKDLANSFIDDCKNEGLQQVAKRWFEYKENRNEVVNHE